MSVDVDISEITCYDSAEEMESLVHRISDGIEDKNGTQTYNQNRSTSSRGQLDKDSEQEAITGNVLYQGLSESEIPSHKKKKSKRKRKEKNPSEINGDSKKKRKKKRHSHKKQKGDKINVTVAMSDKENEKPLQQAYFNTDYKKEDQIDEGEYNLVDNTKNLPPVGQDLSIETKDNKEEETEKGNPVYTETKKKLDTDDDAIRDDYEDINELTIIDLDVSGSFISEIYGVLNKIYYFQEIFRTMSIKRIKSERIRVDRRKKYFQMFLDIVRNDSYIPPATDHDRARLYEECRFFNYTKFLYQMCSAPLSKDYCFEWLTNNLRLAKLAENNEFIKLSFDINQNFIGAIGFEFTIFNTSDFYLDISVFEHRRTKTFEMGGGYILKYGGYIERQTFRVKSIADIGIQKNLPSCIILQIAPSTYERVVLPEVNGDTENEDIIRNRSNFTNPRKNKGTGIGYYGGGQKPYDKNKNQYGIGIDLRILRLT